MIDELAKEGLLLKPLADEVGRHLDPFDLICHVAFDQPPLTRRERVEKVRKRDVFTKYGDKARAVLEALLKKYADGEINYIDDINILKIHPLNSLGTPLEIITCFGGKHIYMEAIREIQEKLYDVA